MFLISSSILALVVSHSVSSLVCHKCAYAGATGRTGRILNSNQEETNTPCFGKSSGTVLQEKCSNHDDVCATAYFWGSYHKSVTLQTCLSLELEELQNKCAYFNGEEHETRARHFFNNIFNETDKVLIKLCTCTWETCNPNSATDVLNFNNVNEHTAKTLLDLYEKFVDITSEQSKVTFPTDASTSESFFERMPYPDDTTSTDKYPIVITNRDNWESKNSTKGTSPTLDSEEISTNKTKLQHEDSSTTSMPLPIVIILVVSGLTLLLVVLNIALILRLIVIPRRSFQKNLSILCNEDVVNANLTIRKNSNKPSDRSASEITFSMDKIDKSCVLSTSEYMKSYHCSIFQNETWICASIKMPSKQSCFVPNLAGVKLLLQELKALSCIGRHQHVVHFYGANTENLRSGKLYLFQESCSFGTLECYLRDLKSNSQRIVPSYFNYLQKWAFEISQGMEFVASKKIIHCDLRTKNILLDSVKTAKIANFNYSRQVTDAETSAMPKPSSWQWMAPESLKEWVFTEKTDVWSYGVVLWELYTFGDHPFQELSWSSNYATHLERGLRLQRPSNVSDEMDSLMLLCWDSNPEKRPRFKDLNQVFKTQIKNTISVMNTQL